MKNIVPIVSLLVILFKSNAQNPLVTHIYTADPTARVFNNKLYLYPSSDAVPPKGIKAPRFCMPGYHMFSLENGSTWKDHGWILKENEVPWGKKNTYSMWAPDCVEKNGKYYYYYPANPKDKSAFRRIGVGVADQPTGPFKWEPNYIEGIEGIDPGILVDDDGKTYLFYATKKSIQVVELQDNMKKIDSESQLVQGLPSGYKEGPFPFKYKGKYYLTFAHVFHNENYTIGYAISEHPKGPYTYAGKVMDNLGTGTNHHSIVNYNDQWILFYHWWELSGHKRLRSMCADYLTFNKEGFINKVKPTKRGIGIPRVGDTIQIDRYNEIKNAKISFVGGNEPRGWMVTETKTKSYVKFNKVDFGNKGSVQKIKARVASGHRVGQMEIRIKNEKGPIIAKFDIENTGGWNSWTTLETSLLKEIEGVQNIVVVFTAEWGDTKLVNLNWLLLQ